MLGEHPDAELAPRDVVARAIWRRRGRGPRSSSTRARRWGSASRALSRRVFALCREHGLDPRVEPMPVSPAAHYHMGGVAVDDRGRARRCPGSGPAARSASTGVHGANRLASNSLLEALVFGARVAERRSHRPRGEAASAPRPAPADGSDRAPIAARDRRRDPPRVRRAPLPGSGVGLVRDGAGLAAAGARLAELWRRLPAARASELRNLLVAGALVAAAALRREESRGAHFRARLPGPDPTPGSAASS